MHTDLTEIVGTCRCPPHNTVKVAYTRGLVCTCPPPSTPLPHACLCYGVRSCWPVIIRIGHRSSVLALVPARSLSYLLRAMRQCVGNRSSFVFARARSYMDPRSFVYHFSGLVLVAAPFASPSPPGLSFAPAHTHCRSHLHRLLCHCLPPLHPHLVLSPVVRIVVLACVVQPPNGASTIGSVTYSNVITRILTFFIVPCW